MDLRDLLGRLHRNYTNPLLWIDPSKYNKPQASALGNRLLANLSASQINYVLVSLLIIMYVLGFRLANFDCQNMRWTVLVVVPHGLDA
jgi:hypothetical protein